MISWHFVRRQKDGANAEARNLVREVLLSYRILFAQGKKSRRHFKKVWAGKGQDVQPEAFLVDLCTMRARELLRKYPLLNNGFDPIGNVFMSSEFPFLGNRLLNLQTFGERHKPMKLFDLYRDRRETEKYYTFWAVIWIGGASLLLSVVQVALAIVQVVLGFRQLKVA